jgi:hypothetical protein
MSVVLGRKNRNKQKNRQTRKTQNNHQTKPGKKLHLPILESPGVDGTLQYLFRISYSERLIPGNSGKMPAICAVFAPFPVLLLAGGLLN